MDKPGPSRRATGVNIADPDFENKIREMLLANDTSLYLSEGDSEEEIDDSDKDPDFLLEESNESRGETSESDNELLDIEPPIDNNREIDVETVNAEPTADDEQAFTYFGKNGFQWQTVEPPRNTRTRQHNIIRGLPGLTVTSRNLGNNPSKSKIWNALVDNDMIDEIVLRTNQKIESVREKLLTSTNKSNYRNTDAIDIKALLGLFMLSAIMKSSHEDMLSLFSKDTLGRPIFRITMSVKRFEILLTCLRFDNSMDREERKKSDPIAAISGIFNKFVSNSQKLFTLGDSVTIDEMLLPFRGHCRFRIYMPSKPAKYGIKVMCMTDARNSYFYNGYIYSGKDSDGVGLSEEEHKLSKPSQSVIRLCKPINGSNRNITADNYFSSLELIDELKKRGLTYVGTLKKNKREIPI